MVASIEATDTKLRSEAMNPEVSDFSSKAEDCKAFARGKSSVRTIIRDNKARQATPIVVGRLPPDLH